MTNSSCSRFPAKDITSFLRAEIFCTDSLLSNPTCISQVLRKLSCQMQATKMQFYYSSGLFCLLFRQHITHPALFRLSTYWQGCQPSTVEEEWGPRPRRGTSISDQDTWYGNGRLCHPQQRSQRLCTLVKIPREENCIHVPKSAICQYMPKKITW